MQNHMKVGHSNVFQVLSLIRLTLRPRDYVHGPIVPDQSYPFPATFGQNLRVVSFIDENDVFTSLNTVDRDKNIKHVIESDSRTFYGF